VPSSFGIIHVDWLDSTFAWAALILNIPLWLMIYQYLDAIMPSEYGTTKHPCFCFRSSKPNAQYRPQNPNDLETNSKIFNETDPILLENLTKKIW
jgi:hypothetical protein